jgi:Tfp pilus assembly protein PilV
MLKRKRARPRRRGDAGFSMLEVVVMVVLLGVVVVPLARLSVTNVRSAGKYAVMTKAVYDAQSIMEAVIADYGNSSRGYSYIRTNYNNVIKATNSGLFNARVTLSAETVLDGITYTTVTVTLSGGGLPENVVLNTWVVK